MEITWPQIITAIVAVYGAAMATVTFFLKRKEKQRQVKVKFSNGFLPNFGTGIGELMLFIEISNPGNRSVVINVPRIILPDGNIIVFHSPKSSNVRFPHKLEEGANCMVWTEMRDLASQLRENGYQGIVKLKADIADGTGHKYESKKCWKIDVDKYAP